MSMKMVEQLQKDHIKLKELSNNKDTEIENQIVELNESIKDLKENFNKKMDTLINTISNSKQTIITDTESTVKDNVVDNIITKVFIPAIDTSDLTINAKEDKKRTKSIDIGSSLDALDNLDKQ